MMQVIHLKYVSSVFALFLLSVPTLLRSAQLNEGFLTAQGIASGDITNSTAVLWSRANQDAQMHIEYDTNSNFLHPKSERTFVDETTDYTGKVKLEGLVPNSLYYYRIWFTTTVSGSGADTSNTSNVLSGSFRTAPSGNSSDQIDLVIGGDLGGSGFCRRAGQGYQIFSLMRDLSPDFFLFNGDQIYADSECPKDAPADTVGWRNIVGDFPSVSSRLVNWTDLTLLHDVYLKHWEYNRNDTHLQSLLQNTSYYSQFDDHEIIDNHGRNWLSLPNEQKNRTGYVNLVKTGTDLFSHFSPIDMSGEKDENRFYRSFNWGKGLDLFILDTRSYRSHNYLVDSLESNKTMLGNIQLEWLKAGLLSSNATWKIVSTSTTMTVPTCFKYGCDSWATNGLDNRTFVRERTDLLEFLDNHDIKNVVFVVTDVHFPARVIVDHDFDQDGDRLIFHELVNGPLSASPLDVQKLDPTINATFLYKESKLFNFDHLSIKKDTLNEKGHLVARVIDNNGIIRPGSLLDLAPQ